ncbi:MAG: hypothetical protein HY363_03290 [Candidatus Aenigmarchaeota archaeon]|nr:hypothetical protein [Candidatus Aenigmarchaeota archaeon]
MNVKISNTLAIALSLSVAALVFGFVFLNTALFHYDAIVLAEAVEKTYSTLRLQPSTNYRYADVVIVDIIYFPFWLRGSTADFSVRLAGVIFYSASIGMLYLFLKKFTNNTLLSLVAAVLFAVSPIYLSPNTFGKIHSISIFFLLLSLWLLLLPERKNFVLAATAYSASIGSRESTLFFAPFALSLCAYSVWKSRQNIWQFLYFFIPLLSFFFLLSAWYFYPIISKTLNGTSVETAFFTYSSANMARALNDLTRTSGTLISLAALVGMISGVVTLRFPAMFLTAWLLSAFFYFSNYTTYEARYLDVVLIPFFAFSGLTVSYLTNKNRIVGYALFGLLLFAPVSYSTQLLLPRTAYNGIYEFGKLISEKTEPDAVIIVQNEAPVVGYYGKRKTLGPPTGNEAESIRFWEDVNKNVTKGENIWLAFSAFFDDPGDINKQIVSQIFDFSKTYSTINEDYHHSDIRQLLYITYLWKLAPKQNMSESTSIPAPFVLKGFPSKK